MRQVSLEFPDGAKPLATLNLVGAQLSNLNLANADLTETDLTGADLTYVWWEVGAPPLWPPEFDPPPNAGRPMGDG